MPKLCRKVLLGLFSNRILSVETMLPTGQFSIIKLRPFRDLFFRVHTWVGGLNPNCNAKLNQPKWFLRWWYQINIQNFKSSTSCAWNCFSVTARPTVKSAPRSLQHARFVCSFWSCSVGVVHPSESVVPSSINQDFLTPQYSRCALFFGSKDSPWYNSHSHIFADNCTWVENKQWNMWNIKHNMR